MIFAALKVQFGLTTREAISKLTTLKKEPKTPLAEYAVEIKKLVGVESHTLMSQKSI